MLIARLTEPSAMARAAASEPPAMSALASCMPGKAGLSAVPMP